MFHVEQFINRLATMTLLKDISSVVSKLPQKPGVYQFYAQSGEIIYIGKAKNLRKRVASYFKTEAVAYKQEVMVRKIAAIRYILVENESDALLLENNLIKEYQPRYNILLKDDKTFPWICIKNERFPRVFSTRNRVEDGSLYFGPYTSGLMVKTLLEMIRRLFKVRTCHYVLSEDNVERHKYKKCLEFHLGNCLAPCEGLQDVSDYDRSIGQIKEILKGNLHTVIENLQNTMQEYARKLQFEDAAEIKQKLQVLEKFQSKSTIVNTRIAHVDVFSIDDDKDYAYVNFLKVVNGAIVQAHNVEVVKRFDEDKKDVLAAVIIDLRLRYSSDAAEVIVPFLPGDGFGPVRFTIPKAGDKLKLLQLSARNIASFRSDRELMRASLKQRDRQSEKLQQVKEDLRLKSLPRHIECFDNSNIQGTNPVASCVVFRNGKPSKSDYRHYNIKTVTGPDDFASMAEIVTRRYQRLLDEKQALPDLIVVDGGKGQLSIAVKMLKELKIYGKVSVVGIAKRLEEIYVPEDPVPLYLDKNSPTLRLLQQIRDEAHRFGITFHRDKRSKDMLHSALLEIPGIGEKSRDKLLKQADDIEKLKSMTLPQLEKIAGKRIANLIYRHYHPELLDTTK